MQYDFSCKALINNIPEGLFIIIFCLFSRPPSPQGIKEDRAKKAANVETLNLDDDDDDEPLAVSFY